MKISQTIHALFITGAAMLASHAPLQAADMRLPKLQLSLGATPPAQHTALPATDLMTVYRDALAQDAQYAAARAAHRAGLEKLPQGRAGLLPSVSLSANTNHNQRDFSFRNGVGGSDSKFNSNGYTVSASQPLYNSQNFAGYAQGKLLAIQAEAQFASVSQDLIVRVAQAYFDVLLAQDNVDLARAQKIAIAEQLEQAKRNFEVGTATITDTHEAQARFDLVTSQEIAATSDLEIKRQSLQIITGKTPEMLKPVSDKLTLAPLEPTDISKWIEKAQEKNLQIAISLATFEIAGREVDRNIGGHLPTLDLVASYSDSGQGSGFQGGVGTDTTTKVIGLQLTLPIFQGGGQQSRVREAYALKDKAAHDLETTKRNAALATRQAFLGVTNGRAQVRALEQALISTQSQLDSTKLGQEVGVRTGVDVLNAQQLLYSARRDLAQARYNFLISRLQLEAAAGELDEEDLRQINGALQ